MTAVVDYPNRAALRLLFDIDGEQYESELSVFKKPNARSIFSDEPIVDRLEQVEMNQLANFRSLFGVSTNSYDFDTVTKIADNLRFLANIKHWKYELKVMPKKSMSGYVYCTLQSWRRIYDPALEYEKMERQMEYIQTKLNRLMEGRIKKQEVAPIYAPEYPSQQMKSMV